VLVVHTPRLCGEPGFMSSKDAGEQARISCREIVAGEPTDQSDAAFIPDADHPLKMPRRKPVLPLPLLKESAKGATTGKYNDMLLKALSGEVEMLDDGDGNIVIQYMEDLPLDGTTDQDALEEAAEQSADRIAQILREAGIDIKSTAAGKFAKKKKNGDEKQDENDAADRRREVDELAT